MSAPVNKSTNNPYIIKDYNPGEVVFYKGLKPTQSAQPAEKGGRIYVQLESKDKGFFSKKNILILFRLLMQFVPFSGKYRYIAVHNTIDREGSNGKKKYIVGYITEESLKENLAILEADNKEKYSKYNLIKKINTIAENHNVKIVDTTNETDKVNKKNLELKDETIEYQEPYTEFGKKVGHLIKLMPFEEALPLLKKRKNSVNLHVKNFVSNEKKLESYKTEKVKIGDESDIIIAKHAVKDWKRGQGWQVNKKSMNGNGIDLEAFVKEMIHTAGVLPIHAENISIIYNQALFNFIPAYIQNRLYGMGVILNGAGECRCNLYKENGSPVIKGSQVYKILNGEDPTSTNVSYIRVDVEVRDLGAEDPSVHYTLHPLSKKIPKL